MSVFMKLLLVATFISNTLVLTISDRITGLGTGNVNEEYTGTYFLMWALPPGNHPVDTLCSADQPRTVTGEAARIITEDEELQLLQHIQSGLIYTQAVLHMLEAEPEAYLTANLAPVETETNKGQTT